MIVPLIKYLLCKHGDPCLDPLHAYKNPGVAACASNPSAKGAERGSSLDLAGQMASLNWRAADSVRGPISKDRVEGR